MSNYDRFPATKVQGYQQSVIHGWDKILACLKESIKDKKVITIDSYPGVYDDRVIEHLKKLAPDVFIDMRTIFKDEKTLNEQLQYHITEDRIFGRMYYGSVEDFLDKDQLEQARQEVKKAKGRVILYGFGASFVSKGDFLVYLDMPRWEITLRYRKNLPNYNCTNYEEDALRKIKRSFFIEWRVADKHKRTIFEDIDFFIDTTKENEMKMVSGEAVRSGLRQTARKPFRTVPYFDPGIWGGQWMKEVCNLDKEQENYAWSFDGVPEENSLLLDFGNGYIELPAMDLVLYQPVELLGRHVYSRFGAEFPIRFDFLDTMGGQNLSLQVHPLTEYIHRQFGMAYTQDESYYILDAKEDACVYLGLKEGINPTAMLEDLKLANQGKKLFDADKYVNKFPAKKHDHFLIPAGTIHCSGKDAMVLEISATPYCFTFKLWDWARVGLDGLPRPVHIDHGKEVIQWDRTTKWVKDNLVNAVYMVHEDRQYKEEHTGLHELEFIETRRYWIKDEVIIENEDNVNMCNLIEGSTCRIESVDASFAPFEVHYAETFIVPAYCNRYKIVNTTESKIGVIRAYVRKPKA